MPITCPNCKTSYQVTDAQIGEKGRSVQCVKCENVWHAYLDPKPVEMAVESGSEANRATSPQVPNSVPQPPVAQAAPPIEPPAQAVNDVSVVPEPEVPSVATPLPEELSQPAAMPEAIAAPESIEHVPASFGEDAPIEGAAAIASSGRAPNDISDAGANIIASVNQALVESEASDAPKPKTVKNPIVKTQIKVRQPNNIRENILGVGAFLTAVGLLASMVVFRESVVRVLPEVSGLYKSIGLGVNLRGLQFSDVTTVNDFENGVATLVVNGTINNVSNGPMDLPMVRFALRTDRGQEVYAWSYKPTVKTLATGQSIGFSTRVASPPEGASDVQLRFIGQADSTENF